MAIAAQGVIGAGHGDEGKGRTVDAIAARLGPKTLVVRSNGGAQAGHSVTTPDGRAHVFHHLGSGALAGAATHLSRFMVSHPMLLAGELRTVAGLGGTIAVSADPRGFVTTPWDMMVNQAAEAARGEGWHGSCGLGFGETVGRSTETGFILTVADLACAGLRDRLIAIRDGWFPARLAALGIDPAGDCLAAARSEALLDRFIADCRDHVALVDRRDDGDLGSHPILFEAAQGLMLDQHHADFPFVTRSSTGIANMLAIAAEAGIDRLDATYVTRCYATRHGRGPMADERDLAGLFAVVDPTNRPNPWQENLRTGLVDVGRLATTIQADLALAAAGPIAVAPHLAVSCLDQAVGGRVTCIVDGMVATLDAADFVALLGARIGARTLSAWLGPARDDAAPATALLPFRE